MKRYKLFLLFAYCVAFVRTEIKFTEDEIVEKLKIYSEEAEDLCYRKVLAMWNAETDVGNKVKELEQQRRTIEFAQFQKKHWEGIWSIANESDYVDEFTRRQLNFLKRLGESVLTPIEVARLSEVITNMTSVYATTQICPFDRQNCDLKSEGVYLTPNISRQFAESRNIDELKYLWKSWHDKTGKLLRSRYKTYINLINTAAKGNNYSDASKWWQSEFEDENLENNIDKLWQDAQPLYNELHTYMRYKLISIYGSKINRADPNIPANLLGDLWAQSWRNLFNDIKPFKTPTLLDVTNKLQELNLSPKRLFDEGDSFFTNMDLPTNIVSYTGEAVIVKPNNRIVQCHPNSWDFCNKRDYRIKMCASVDVTSFISMLNELGQIQYFMQYKELPITLRRAANPSVAEAIAGAITLSSATNAQHLSKTYLLDGFQDSYEENINALLFGALSDIPNLAFSLIVDKWRWDIFRGNVSESRWNTHWWKLREQYQKLGMPIERTEDDLDPASNYIIAKGKQSIGHFISSFSKFQLYKSFCIAAQQYDPLNPAKPLHKCDFYRSDVVGKKISDGLKLGASKHWSEVLQQMTGETNITSDAFLEYYKPLYEFLLVENERLKKEDDVRQELERYNVLASQYCRRRALAEWDVITDINNIDKHEIFKQATAENAQFLKDQYKEHYRNLNISDYPDEKIRRQIIYIRTLGLNALNESQLREYSVVKANMEKIYTNAAFCDFYNRNCSESERMTLDPEISDIMAKSNDFEQLKYTWEMWHNSSGALMKNDYKKYVELTNQAAVLNGLSDYGEMWRSKYEDKNFTENIIKIWKKVEPLYDELHKYTRYKLIDMYGDDKVKRSDPLIPAHLLGNMWAQTWVNLYDRIKPFKGFSDIDITKSLQRHNYTALKIFQESDRFYRSLGLPSNEVSYRPPAIIEKPSDRIIVCHASAWDLCDGEDYRIKQCTTVNHRNFITAHHEMGHIQYYIQYKDQPLPLRAGANPGFHEAVGDLVALSVSNPSHLKKIGLLENYTDTYEDNINALFKMALERVAFLPFGLLIDLYRYDVFNKSIPDTQWNRHWEILRQKYQKIRSPVKRTEKHFDAGAKFHVPADVQYAAYFVAHILEFQFLKALCLAAGQYEPNNHQKPLHKCDIQDSLEAGKRLKAGLSLGLSKHWTEALSIITNGDRDIKADAILEYFHPLYEFLKKENERIETATVVNEDWSLVYLLGIFIAIIIVIALVAYLIYQYNKR